MLCRQPEFTQLDMEMTFMDCEAIMALVEDLVAAIFQQAPLRPSNFYLIFVDCPCMGWLERLHPMLWHSKLLRKPAASGGMEQESQIWHVWAAGARWRAWRCGSPSPG